MLLQRQWWPGGNRVGPLAWGVTSCGEPDVLLGAHAQRPRDITDDRVSHYQLGEATN